MGIKFLVLQTAEASKGPAYEIGYKLGYFVGSYFYEILAVIGLCCLAFLYFRFVKKKKTVES